MASRREQLQCFDFSQDYYKNVTYHDVATTDYYRRERPYRIFRIPGVSAVTITFGLSGAENVSKVILSLNHCRTTADGVVDIAVNGVPVLPNLMAPRDNFGTESFNLDSTLFNSDSNVLTIQLGSGSPGVYWLSDAIIDVEIEVDETEDAMQKNGRDIFVTLKKLLVGRRKTIENLRKVAADLDQLHQTINKVKVAGDAASLGGDLLILGGAALEIISAGMATPVVAVMETAGLSLIIGGSVVDIGASVWNAVKEHSEVKKFEENVAEDKACCEKLAGLETGFKHQMMKQQELYRSKYPSLAGMSTNQLVTAGLMMSVSNISKEVTNDVAKMSSEEGFKTLADVSQVVGLDVMKQVLRFLSVVGVAVTVADLMERIAEISKGSPSEMAKNVREAADQLEKDLSSIQKFLQDALNFFLENLNKELKSSNLLSASKILNVLAIFDEIRSRHGSLNMSWLNGWNNFESTLQPEQLAALANTLNQLYQELEDTLTRNRNDDPINLVIVAHGSVGASSAQEAVPLPGLREASVIPSQMCFATNYVTSVTFYQPWGVLIDARANYGIVSGSIAPSQTRFEGVGHAASIPNTLTRFNVLQSASAEMIPMVWCNPINDNDNALRELLGYILTRGTSRPYVWWRIGSVPSFFITAMASMAAMLLSIGTTRIDLRIHHAQCLNWPSRVTEPPAELRALNQYYNAIAETYTRPFKMTI